MKVSMKYLIRLLVFCFVVSFFTSASAAQTVNMSYNGPPDVKENAVHYFATNFKQLVEENTNGKIKVRLYPNSQLGNEEQRMEQTMSGPMINVASFAGVAPLFSEMFASNIPFMFNSYEAAHEFFDNSQWWKNAQVEFEKRSGVELLEAVEEGGFLAFTNGKREIRNPADFKGLKFRAMDESQIALYKAFGASGTPIPWTEVYMALRTGVADGQMNPPMYIIMGSLHEVQKYACMANIQYSYQFLLINGDWMKGLPEETRAVIRSAAHDANAMNRASVGAEVAGRVAFLKEKGMQIYHPTTKEMDQFREMGQPSYVEWLKGKMDSSWIDLAVEGAAKANEKAGN